MLLLTLSVVLYLSTGCRAEGDKGIVKKVMGDDEPWPEEGKRHYTHYLECDYRHGLPGDTSVTYTYDIHCLKFNDDSELTLSINVNFNVFDNFIVSSCELEDIVNSVFPHKQATRLTSGHDEEDDEWEEKPSISYLQYRKDDGDCYARKYQYRLRAASAATRSTPVKVDCPGKSGWSKFGEVAKFTNCRVAKLPLSHIVKDWGPEELDWTPNSEKGNKYKEQLDCTFDQFSKLFNLKCLQGNEKDNEHEHFVFVSNQGRYLDRFSVSSCKEEDIVNGIFPIKETTANPKDYGWVIKIYFARDDDKCYWRKYPDWWQETEKEAATLLDCPKVPDEWINPSWGFAGQWRECKGPMSISERPKKSSEPSLVTEEQTKADHKGAQDIHDEKEMKQPQKGTEHSVVTTEHNQGTDHKDKDKKQGSQ